MKKSILVIVVILLSVVVNAQKKDSIPQPHLTVDSAYLSIRMVNDALEGIKDKVTAKQFENFSEIWNYVIQVTSKDWETKHNQPKK